MLVLLPSELFRCLCCYAGNDCYLVFLVVNGNFKKTLAILCYLILSGQGHFNFSFYNLGWFCINFNSIFSVLFLQVAYNCLHAAKMHFMKFLLELYLDICTNLNGNYKGILTEFVNTNNHTHHFLHWFLIIQGAKNYSQHAKSF